MIWCMLQECLQLLAGNIVHGVWLQHNKWVCPPPGLSFLLVWSACLWFWSIPVILIEYGVGRYTRKTVIESFGTLLGPAFRFLGGFVVIVQFFIT